MNLNLKSILLILVICSVVSAIATFSTVSVYQGFALVVTQSFYVHQSVLLFLVSGISCFALLFLLREKKIGDKGKLGNKESLGQIKWFNMKKGYGFITCDSGEDVFVHFREITGASRGDLRAGQKVSFAITQGDKGPQAEKVKLLS